MAYPPAYDRAYSFTDYEVNFPGEPKPGDKLDTEFDAVSNALTATQTNLALIQRADGALANGSVGVDQLQTGLFDGIADGITDEAQAAADAAAASAALAQAAANAAVVADNNAGIASEAAGGSAAQAGVSQGIAQSAANDAALSASDAAVFALNSEQASNDTAGSVAACEAHVERAFEWAELLTGPVLPAPPGWPEAVDDGMFSSKWWAIRARDYNATEVIDLGTAGTDVGNAFDIWDAIPGNDLGIGQTYATWGTPTHTYVLIDRSNPSDPASWQDITGGPGPPGPPNTLTVGTVNTGAPGSAALVSITGVSPNQVLNMQIPAGATGATGPIGPAGPPNALAIGTVTTVPDGSPAGATITGTSPTQTLNLTIPAGPQGIQGIQGIQGPVGPAVNLANPTGVIGLVAVNGIATTAPRSDSTHALSQAIAPTWTGAHTFTQPTFITAPTPVLRLTATGAAVDKGLWDFIVLPSDGSLRLRHINDAAAAASTWVAVTPSGVGANITSIAFGISGDNPTYIFSGTGVVTSGGVHRGPDGSAAAPTYSFAASTNSGMSRTGENVVVLSNNGIETARLLTGGGFQITGNGGGGYAGGPGLELIAGVNLFYLTAFDRSVGFVIPLKVSCKTFDLYGYFNNVNITMTDFTAISSLSGDGYLRLNNDLHFPNGVYSPGRIMATNFTVSSSRTLKRVTGTPRRAGDLLARLRPLLYRLLDGDDSEQLGLIAEEVHEVCPQLSDGKSVAYDRLAILLLAAWQDEHAEAA